MRLLLSEQYIINDIHMQTVRKQHILKNFYYSDSIIWNRFNFGTSSNGFCITEWTSLHAASIKLKNISSPNFSFLQPVVSLRYFISKCKKANSIASYNIPYLIEYKSHFFVPKYHPKSQVWLIHEYMKCIICRTKFFEVFPCYAFLRCLLSYDYITYCLLCE